MKWTTSITAPRTASTQPVTRLRVRGSARLAKTAETWAAARVTAAHTTRANRSMPPPMATWDSAPVRAVKVMMNTLVPTAVLSSYPSTEVNTSSIIMPPPAPMKPQMKPMTTPHTTDSAARIPRPPPGKRVWVAVTGKRMNRTPSSRVMHTEKPLMASLGIWKAAMLPTRVSRSTTASMRTPFFTSRFRCLA